MPLHPQVKQFLDDLAEQKVPSWEELTPAEGREVLASLSDLCGEAEPVAKVEDIESLRVYTPTGNGPFPALVYFHGGGWVLGDLDTHDSLCRRLANAACCVVVSVDYRRSPEAKFPAALEDCYAATQRAAEHAEQFNIDASRIAVAGDSAGANLAAAVALMARDQGNLPIHFQLLIYPVMSHGCDTSSFNEFAQGFGLTKVAMMWFWQQYLESDEDGKNPYASPLLADNLRGLPPAHIVTAGHDVLRDEGEAYAARLIEAGVPTTQIQYEGMIHGFVNLAGLFDTSKQAARDIATVLLEVMKK